MGYRTVELNWLPRTSKQWQTFTQTRQASAQVWNDLVRRHARIRRLGWKFPTKPRLEKWAKRRYPGLHSQTVQQIIGEFTEAIASTTQLRKNGHPEARYPHRLLHYRDVPYTNQAARLSGTLLALPCGINGKLKIRLPVDLPGRLLEVRLCYSKVLLVCEIPADPTPAHTTLGVDLGVNTLIAATDGETAIVISGREAKATVQWRNKRLASLQTKQSQHQRGSRRWKRLQQRKYKLLDKSRRRLKDITHKATHIVRQQFPSAQVYVGEPFNDAAQKLGRGTAQQVSSACNRKIIQQLDYKTCGAIEVNEAYSSQTCPVCGCRQQCRRVYHCRECGYTAPRDVVGATNILRVGREGELHSSSVVPQVIHHFRPSILHCDAGSSGGHPASSSKGISSTRNPQL
jgi:putative transposase